MRQRKFRDGCELSTFVDLLTKYGCTRDEETYKAMATIFVLKGDKIYHLKRLKNVQITDRSKTKFVKELMKK